MYNGNLEIRYTMATPSRRPYYARVTCNLHSNIVTLLKPCEFDEAKQDIQDRPLLSLIYALYRIKRREKTICDIKVLPISIYYILHIDNTSFI